MHNVINKIEEVLKSGVLIPELCTIPEEGISEDYLRAHNYFDNDIISKNSQYIELLKKWNGIDLDIIRIFGTNKNNTSQEIRFDPELSLLLVASDPAGFLYGMDKKGCIYSIDTKSNVKQQVAESFDDFIVNFIFGTKSEEFLGKEWRMELEAAGIID